MGKLFLASNICLLLIKVNAFDALSFWRSFKLNINNSFCDRPAEEGQQLKRFDALSLGQSSLFVCTIIFRLPPKELLSALFQALSMIFKFKRFKKWHNGKVTDKIDVLRTRTMELIGEFWLKNKGYFDPVKMIAHSAIKRHGPAHQKILSCLFRV